MRRDDPDDPFGDIFDEIERMMGGMGADGGFGSETHVDVQDLDDRLRLVADLPGVEKEGIDLKCDGKTLTISAVGEGHEYDEHIRLPARVDEHSARATFNNGILQVTLEKTGESADIDLD